MMKLLVHDLPAPRAKQIFGNLADIRVFSPEQPIHPCRGCFGCWVKTPGACVLHDAYQQMGRLLAQCSAWIIFSRCVYGGFSPFVKNVLDRSIPYLHPDFILQNGEMHHRPRYSNQIELSFWFYGTDITEAEKATARALVQANATNLHGHVRTVQFLQEPEKWGGSL